MNDLDPALVAPVRRERSPTGDFLLFLVKLAFVVAALRSFVFAPFVIPSESMLPQLLVGDYLIVSKWPYGYSRWSLPFGAPLIAGRVLVRLPARGDVVVFKRPPAADLDVVKRVIGLPGDVVQMQGGQLFINARPIAKQPLSPFVVPRPVAAPCLTPTAASADSCSYPRFRETLPEGRAFDVLDLGRTLADDTRPYRVPEGQLFVMGDDRDDSGDSRLEAGGFGFVPLENLVGRAELIAFSTDGSASYWRPWTWFSAARWHRIGQRL